eukprot:s8690_g1.t1
MYPNLFAAMTKLASGRRSWAAPPHRLIERPVKDQIKTRPQNQQQRIVSVPSAPWSRDLQAAPQEVMARLPPRDFPSPLPLCCLLGDWGLGSRTRL